MKTVYSRVFFGVMIAGLLYGASSLWAQPASAPATVNDELSPTSDNLAPSDSDSAPSNSDLAPSDSDSAPFDGDPTRIGGDPATGDEAIVVDAPDKPWSRGISMENRNAARTLFLEGNRLFRIPLFARAAEKYIAALGKWKHPAIYLNLAIAQLNAGQEVDARASLKHALEHDVEPLGPENFQGARLQLQELERRLGRIRVSCQTPGAQVTLDGVLLFTGPGSYEGWVKAKEHEITAKKNEYLSEARRVTVASGQGQNVELKLITLREAAEASRRWAAWKPWAVFAAGGAVTAIGGTFHTLAFREFENHDRKFVGTSCGSGPSPGCRGNEPDLELLNLDDRLKLARRERAIALGSYIVGGSLLTTGLVLLYLNRPRLTERVSGYSSGRGVAIIPAMSGDMVGILIDVAH